MNNEAILNKLIELGYLPQHHTEWQFRINSADDYLALQRALFDVCAKKELTLCTLWHGGFEIGKSTHYFHDRKIAEMPDTSRESFVAAFCKVVGI